MTARRKAPKSLAERTHREQARPLGSMDAGWTDRPINWLAPAAVLFLATILVYIPAMHCGFIWDDEVLLTDNPLIKNPHGLRDIWLSAKNIDYVPLVSTSFWIEWRLFGDNPVGYHVVNVLLHGCGAVLLWRVLERLMGVGRWALGSSSTHSPIHPISPTSPILPSSPPFPSSLSSLSWLAALIWAVHPVNVASVAWISEQKNTLSMVFFLLAILAYLKYENSERPSYYFAAIFAFLLALFAKGSVVILPAELLLFAWWQRGGISRLDIVRTLPMFALSAVFSLITIKFMGHPAILSGPIPARGFPERLAGAAWAFWFYIYKFLIPVHLTMVYPLRNVNPHSAVSWLPLLAALAVKLVVWWNRRNWGRPILAALGYFALALLPILGFIDISFMAYSLVADHWQYIAMPGVVVLVVVAASRALESVRADRTTQVILAALVVATLSFLTWNQQSIYQSQETLWKDTLQKNPDAWTAHFNYGTLLQAQGDNVDAMAQLKTAVLQEPAYEQAHVNLGNTLLADGKTADALAQFELAVRLDPGDVAAQNQIGTTLTALGRYAEAEPHFRALLHINPQESAVHNNYGTLLAGQGKIDEAIAQFEEAIRRKSDYAEAYQNLGLAYASKHKYSEAASQYRTAINLLPDYTEAHTNLGNAYLAMGKTSDAISEYQTALKLRPDYADARYNLELAYKLEQREKDGGEALGNRK